jgi:hypothetical protein
LLAAGAAAEREGEAGTRDSEEGVLEAIRIVSEGEAAALAFALLAIPAMAVTATAAVVFTGNRRGEAGGLHCGRVRPSAEDPVVDAAAEAARSATMPFRRLPVAAGSTEDAPRETADTSPDEGKRTGVGGRNTLSPKAASAAASEIGSTASSTASGGGSGRCCL